MDIEGVVIFDSKSGIPLFSRLRKGLDASLFSSFVTAITHFSKELKLGGLSSFTTEEKRIILAAKDNTITALITPIKKEFMEAHSLAMEMGRQFEDLHIRVDSMQEKDYSEFQVIADDFMKKIKNPFISRVAAFIHDKYGGSISIKPRVLRESGAEHTIDMLVNLGTNGGTNPGNVAHTAYMESNIFCKIAQGKIARGEVMEFLDVLDSFGVRIVMKGEMVFVPYFPTRAAIIAHEISNDVKEYLGRLPKKDGARYIDGSHVFAGRKLKGAPKNPKCFVDVFEWHDDGTAKELQF